MLMHYIHLFYNMSMIIIITSNKQNVKLKYMWVLIIFLFMKNKKKNVIFKETFYHNINIRYIIFFQNFDIIKKNKGNSMMICYHLLAPSIIIILYKFTWKIIKTLRPQIQIKSKTIILVFFGPNYDI
jgi:hypothetical protein